MRGVNNSVETINAAATAIVTAESRVQQATVQKRRWGGCLSLYWCFGSQRHGKRIGHAILVPESILPRAEAPATENSSIQSTLILPFIAPPSSPVSFLQSEPPSATQSPAGLLSLTSLSANVYSPGGANSIFAIGPYAHETQLVSPPVFSTFTTEPSTAPLTPPPESVHLTTPSSPEVPFAQLVTSSLDHNHKAGDNRGQFLSSHYEFQSYQLYPGSPVGHLISPSAVTGTTSPFPDLDFPSGSFPPFRSIEPPKLLNLDAISMRKSVQQYFGPVPSDSPKPPSQDGSLLSNQIPEVASLANSDNGSQNGDLILHRRVSFELTAEEVSSGGNDHAILDEATTQCLSDTTAATSEADRLSSQVETNCKCNEAPNTLLKSSSCNNDEQSPQPPSLVLGGVKEFKFDNADGASTKPAVESDWWANEKVVGVETEPHNNWAFFPMIRPGVS